jgi:hypothetical protein
MNKYFKLVAICFIVLNLVLSGCGPGQAFGPTLTPVPSLTPIPTNTPVPTSTTIPTATNTPTPAPTATATPAPICHIGDTVQGTIDDKIPGYLDITKVSTSLDGKKFTVVFSLRELPDQITINQKDLKQGMAEIAWGVAIDTDNNPDTGGKVFITRSGYGYDTFLQTFHFKKVGGERTGPFNLIFPGDTYIWESTEKGISGVAPGIMSVDSQAKTLTLTAEIPNISSDSVLSFYTVFVDAKNPSKPIVDELCKR